MITMPWWLAAIIFVMGANLGLLTASLLRAADDPREP